MSLSVLSGFADGLGYSMQRQRDREEMARYTDALQQRQPSSQAPMVNGPTSGTFLPQSETQAGYSVVPQAQTANVQAQAGSGPPTIVGLLRKHEGAGDPNTLFAHSQRDGGRFAGYRVADRTIGELKEFSSPSGEYGQWVKQKLAQSGQRARVATPMGFGQIVGTTLRNSADQLGLSDDTPFNEDTQAMIVNHLARQRLANAKTPAARRAQMRAEWEGFKHVSDSDLDAAISNFEANGGVIGQRPMSVTAM